MPRIEPERLLKCLQPLLESTTGAIKSSDEVDKVLGLMSKFSKKLVSKCIYINILKATQPEVVDSFMQRGGWNLIFSWTNDAVTTRNYPLIKLVLDLLLITPTTINQLKENKFPLVVKGLSKDCENEEVKNLAKEVVARWISIAKGEQTTPPIQNLGFPVQPVPQAQEMLLEQSPIGNHVAVAQQQDADPLLNIDPTFLPDADTGNSLMDLGLSNTDLANIDFNLDIFSKVVAPEQGLTDTISNNTSVGQSVGGMQLQTPVVNKTEFTTTTTANVVISNVNTFPTTSTSTTIQSEPPKQEVYEVVPMQTAPKVYIKTVGGQRTVVQNLDSDGSQFCVLIKDGKNFIMKLKQPSCSSTFTSGEAIQISDASIANINSEDSTDSAPTKDTKVKAKKEKTPKVLTAKPSEGNELKTYSKSKPIVIKDGSSSLSPTKKSSDQNAKPSGKSDKDKKPSSTKDSNKSSSSDGHRKSSKSSSSRSKAEAAAAAAKQHAAEEKLKEQIRNQKALMKKRAKEAEKTKQQEKDQETLKKLNLAPPSSTSPSSGLKIPKIPKKSTSFIDAIGIPGAEGVTSIDKIKKVQSDKSVTSSVSKKSPEKSEEVDESTDKPKERKHKPKVFASSKSKTEDLIKEIEKSKTPKEKEESKQAQGVSGNSIPAVPPSSKITKRHSTDSIEKPGDLKKAKLASDGSSKTEKQKESSSYKEKDKKKPTIAIKESSLFMDMLNASSETTKPIKRKRRLSTGNDKEPISPLDKLIKQSSLEKEDNDSSNSNSSINPAIAQELPIVPSTPEEPVNTPVFNFYRETLNDSPEEDNQEPNIQEKEISREQPSTSRNDVEPMDQDGGTSSFTPQEGDGKLKSALCLHRSRNKPKKSVRWKVEEELVEHHFFEMDETERVNVTKQKDFSELSQNEKAHERDFLIRRKAEEEEQQSTYRLMKIDFIPPHNVQVNSQERDIQEDRERNTLALFLPPGAPLPETGTEPEPMSPIDRSEPRLIPVEDVTGITKVCDFRTHSWPAPKQPTMHQHGFNTIPHDIDSISHTSTLNPFPPPTDFNNPWNHSNPNLGFGVPPPGVVPNIPEMAAYQGFPPAGGNLNMNMNFLNAPPATAAMQFAATQNPFAFPPPPMLQPPMNGLPSFPNNGRDARMGNPNRGGGRFNDSDQRRNFHGNRDRGGGRGDRDYRDDRGGGRDRDRDFRRRDKDDRDYNRHNNDRDRDRNNRDFRSGSGRNSRKDIPCKFFRNGHCSSGNKCQFLHDDSTRSNNHQDESRGGSRHDFHSNDPGRSRRSPESHKKDVDLRQSSLRAADEDWESNSLTPKSPNDVDDTRFALPPSSPAEPEVPGFSSSAESTKVIPV